MELDLLLQRGEGDVVLLPARRLGPTPGREDILVSSLHSYHAITPVRVDICPPIVSVEEKHSQRKNFNIFFPYLTWKETKTRVTESSDSDIKKLMTSAVPESTKKSPKHAINVFEGEESHE